MNLERGSVLFNRTIEQCRSIGRVVVAPVPGICAHVRRHMWRRSRLPPNRRTKRPGKLSNVSMLSVRGSKAASFAPQAGPRSNRATTNPTVGAQGRDSAA